MIVKVLRVLATGGLITCLLWATILLPGYPRHPAVARGWDCQPPLRFQEAPAPLGREWEKSPLKLTNPGFEDSSQFQGWIHPPNGAVDASRPGKGKRSARLRVSSRTEKGVSLIQRVPVEPGARYEASALVRTRGVKPARVLGMRSVGAVLIVEWLDQKGNWLTSGAYSREGWFGTQPWTRHAIRGLSAPSGAAFAAITLALRGTGEAWFDDVRFDELPRVLTLTAPPRASTLTTNRPTLAWQEDRLAQGYQVQLARNREFLPGEDSFSRYTERNCYRPPKGLARGRWYWRVRAQPGRRWSPVWNFVQSAAQDADTSGPEITLASRCITHFRQALGIIVKDSGGVNAASLAVCGLKGRTVKVRAQGEKFWAEVPGGWPRGAHRLVIRAADGLGNQSRRSFWVVVSPPSPRRYTWTKERGVFNGKRHGFPLGIYQVEAEDLAKVKAAGFDLVHHYFPESSQNDALVKGYLDRVYQAGLKAFIGFDRGLTTKMGLIQLNHAHVARRIAALRDHPGLLAWYLFDEPDHDPQYVAPRNLRAHYSLVKALDPYHPVIVTLARRGSIRRYGPGCYDVYWSMVYGDARFVQSQLTRHQGQLAPSQPHMAILHAYDREQQESFWAGIPFAAQTFRPSHAELRANAFMALAQGSSGLVWWWFGDRTRRYLSVGDVPAAWEGLARIVKQIKRLEPFLVAGDEELSVRAAGKPPGMGLLVRAIRAGGKILVFVVNPHPKQGGGLSISSPDFPAQAIVKVRFENRSVKLLNQEITDRIGPLGVQVYQIDNFSQ